MDNRTDDLWQGGPWEQPSPQFPTPPAVRIPAHAIEPRRPVLRPRRRRRGGGIALLVVLILVLTGIAVAVGSRFFPRAQLLPPPSDQESDYYQEQEYSTQPPSIPRAETGTGVTVDLKAPSDVPLTYTQIYDKNAVSMVSIMAVGPSEYSSGTGIILTGDGYIITNAHVVAGAEQVRVSFYDNSVLSASLVGFDADEDLAVLKVEASGLSPAEFGDSSALRCGDPVAALGDPLGYRSTITDGIVSALDREVKVDGITMTLIQTNAAINFGNSGGALINQYGQVVGITTVKIVTKDGSAEALGFAIPSRRVKYVADTLIDGREVRTGIFGFTVLTQPVPGGLELQSVDPRSDAGAKGLQAGDVISAVNGQTVTGIQDLIRAKLSLGPGDTVELTCQREGESFTVEVALVDAELID